MLAREQSKVEPCQLRQRAFHKKKHIHQDSNGSEKLIIRRHFVSGCCINYGLRQASTLTFTFTAWWTELYVSLVSGWRVASLLCLRHSLLILGATRANEHEQSYSRTLHRDQLNCEPNFISNDGSMMQLPAIFVNGTDSRRPFVGGGVWCFTVLVYARFSFSQECTWLTLN